MTAICSWCSAEVAEGAVQCPSCGANLVPDGDTDVPGVTAVDAASIIRSKSATQPRSRLLSWISGEYQTDVPSKAEQQAIAPPDLDVRREILRLELEAEVANLQAEADALRAEAVAEGRVLEIPDVEGPRPDGAEEGSIETTKSGEATAAVGDATAEVTTTPEDAAGTSEGDSVDKASA
jgi:hypothetical protein